MVSTLLFHDWTSLKACKLSELKGVELIKVKNAFYLEKHSNLKSPQKLIAYGYRPHYYAKNLLQRIRQSEPLQNVRLLVEPNVSPMDLGGLIRTASLAGCHSVTLLNNKYSTFDDEVVRSSGWIKINTVLIILLKNDSYTAGKNFGIFLQIRG